jgi:uncharacterized membrane protein (UPF0127 family)
VSAHRLATGIGFSLGAVIIAGALFVALHQHHPVAGKPVYATETLQLQNRTISLEVADTQAKQELGLGQRDSLANNKGMIFTYAQEKELCFWMKDMHFPIDMVWLDGDKRVIHLEANVSPDTYPKTYCPDKPAQYVVELNANVAGQSGIRIGQQLKF